MQTRSRLERYQNLYSNQNEQANQTATSNNRYNDDGIQTIKNRTSLNTNSYQDNAVRYNKMIKEHEEFLSQMEEKYAQIGKMNPSFETPNTSYQQPSNRAQNNQPQFQPQQNPFIRSTQFSYQSPNSYNQPSQSIFNQRQQFAPVPNDPFEQQVQFAQNNDPYQQQAQFNQQVNSFNQMNQNIQAQPQMQNIPFVDSTLQANPYAQTQNPFEQTNNFSTEQTNPFEQASNLVSEQPVQNPFEQSQEDEQFANTASLEGLNEVTKDDIYSGNEEENEDAVSLQYESVKVDNPVSFGFDEQIENENAQTVVDDVFATEEDLENSAIDDAFVSNVQSAVSNEPKEEKISIYTEEKIGQFFDEIINAEKNPQPVNEQPKEESIQPVVEQPKEESIQPVVEQPKEELIQPVVEQAKEESIQPVVENKQEEVVESVKETKAVNVIQTPIISIINIEDNFDEVNEEVETVKVVEEVKEEPTPKTETIIIHTTEAEEEPVVEQQTKIEEKVEQVDIVVEQVEEEPIDALPIEQANIVPNEIHDEPQTQDVVEPTITVVEPQPVESQEIISNIEIKQENNVELQQGSISNVEVKQEETEQEIVIDDKLMNIINELQQSSNNNEPSLDEVHYEPQGSLNVKFYEDELLEGKEIKEIVEEPIIDKKQEDIVEVQQKPVAEEKQEEKELVIDDNLMAIINEVKQSTIVHDSLDENVNKEDEIEGDFDDITRILDEVKSYSKQPDPVKVSYDYQIKEEKIDEPTLSEIIKTKEMEVEKQENNESIEQLTQRIEQERIMREELLEKTRQLNIQISEYENEVDDLNTNMNKTGKLLNVIITILVIALFFIIIVIGYWFFQERGLI